MKKKGEIIRGPKEYFNSLESLRGLAAVFVIFHHMKWASHIYFTPFREGSWLFVDLFFVISGFVLAFNYQNNIVDAQSMMKFMIFRIGRLFPLHFVLLNVWLIYECIQWVAITKFGIAPGMTGPFTENNFGSYLANVFFIHSMGIYDYLTFNGPSWSISVEFFTYITFAIIMLIYNKRLKLKIAAYLFLIIFSFSLLISPLNDRMLATTFHFGIFRCWLSFFIGCLVFNFRELGMSVEKIVPRKYFSILEILALFLIGYSLVLGAKIDNLTYLAVPIFAFSVWVFTGTNGVISTLLQNKILLWLGKHSYSIYINHMIVVTSIYVSLRTFKFPQFDINNSIALSKWSGDMLVIVTLGIIFIISSLTYRIIEEPGRNYFRSIYKKKST
ncbi:MAG: acyltransferase [Emcibacteraceae bacterium]